MADCMTKHMYVKARPRNEAAVVPMKGTTANFDSAVMSAADESLVRAGPPQHLADPLQ